MSDQKDLYTAVSEVDDSTVDDLEYIDNALDLVPYRLVKKVIISGWKPDPHTIIFPKDMLCFVAKTFCVYTRVHKRYPKETGHISDGWFIDHNTTREAVLDLYNMAATFLEETHQGPLYNR